MMLLYLIENILNLTYLYYNHIYMLYNNKILVSVCLTHNSFLFKVMMLSIIVDVIVTRIDKKKYFSW